ncbi:EH signature domain-containing protein [Accumulibacter sp.]|uniref:EH signature domain-containing protein n=1 Tax=Accumulibacter sp. TaxID=2053492 RepID=UPI0025EBF888|nr:EH signature domain-containing protein [Accumulibacter sp.]MCM8625595.1 EH signature domain-containing protein [Accumulibacter sp.]
MTLALTLRQALDQLASPRPSLLPAVPRCAEAVVRATAGLVDGGEPTDPKHLDHLIARFREGARNGVLDDFAARDWNEIVWGIWREPEPLAENDDFLDALFARLQSGSRRLCRRLVLAYLTAFDAAKESFRRIGGVLQNAVSAWDWDWKKRQYEFALFEPERAPAVLAAHCLNMTTSVSECFEQAGISGSRRFCGMERAAFGHALNTVRNALETGKAGAPELLDRLFAWATHEGRLAFPQARTAMAEALLLPWQTRTPRDDVRERITEFLLRSLQDPRIKPINWHGVQEEALRVIRKWLTRVALEQFLQVVDKVAEAGHWRYRRAFWMAYYEKGLIDEAWVVFGPTAERMGAWGLSELAGFGRLASPRQSNHCVLLMRLAGDLTVAEMSHSGKCRIWLAGRKEAPPLYSASYRVREIEREPDFEVSHHSSDQFGWQRKIAGFLASNAGLRVPEANFRPR